MSASDRPSVLVLSLQVGAEASKGHLNPLIGLVQWLIKQGADVYWLAGPRSMGDADTRQVEAQGARILPTPAIPGDVILSTEELSRLATDPRRSWEVYRSFLLDPLPWLVPRLRTMLRELSPTVVAGDCMAYSGLIAAHLEGIPYVGICAGLKLLKEGGFEGGYLGDFSAIEPLRTQRFREYGIEPQFRLFEYVSPYLNTVFATRAFVGGLPAPPNTVLVGPTIPPGDRGDETPFPWDRLATDRPVVYGALGSIHARGTADEVVRAMIGGTALVGAQLVLSSASMAQEPTSPADHVLVVPYAPQLKLLSRVDAFITHGGANSVMEGLYSGVPLLVVPLASDQPLQARLVEEAGVGHGIERTRFTAESCAASLRALLDPTGPIRQRVREVQASYRAEDGARVAAEQILALGRRAMEGRESSAGGAR